MQAHWCILAVRLSVCHIESTDVYKTVSIAQPCHVLSRAKGVTWLVNCVARLDSRHPANMPESSWVRQVGGSKSLKQCQPMLATCQQASTSFIDMLNLLTIHVALAQCLHVSPAAACSHISHCLMTSICPASQVIRFKQAHRFGIPIYHHLPVVKGVNNPPIDQPTNGKSTSQNYKPLQGMYVPNRGGASCSLFFWHKMVSLTPRVHIVCWALTSQVKMRGSNQQKNHA